jgi:signal transduction histidine kinase
MNTRDNSGQPPRINIIFGLAAIAVFFIACLMLAYFVLHRTELSEPQIVLFSGIGGLLIFGVIAFVFGRMRMHKFKTNHSGILRDTVFYALEQISQGNFNITLSPRDNTPFAELIDAINEMAKNLGSLETMRQDFISNVSHEIQSPLTSIKGFAALLKSDVITAEERKHYAEIIEAESRRMSAMSENLLRLSSLDSGNEPLNRREYRLDKQLQSVALALEPQWSAKHITLDVDAEKTTVNADEDLFVQVWTNILANAIKFTPENGRISIILKDNSVTIRDTGIGIAESDLVHIFERFYKADKSRDRSLGGNGLGLSIAHKIVTLHGGTINAESEAGKGTAFKVTLPQKD